MANEAKVETVIGTSGKDTLAVTATLSNNRTTYMIRCYRSDSGDAGVTIVMTGDQAINFAELIVQMEKLAQ